MINLLHIVNFQSHKESILEFHSGVNIIVGSSDSGKTSIMRALNLAINNKPSGDGFRRHGTKETWVQLTTDDGIKITRVKTKSNNEYRLEVNGKEESFKAFGQGVPEEVTKALNLLPLNMQSQMDPPFLLHESFTPGKVAEILNKAVNLDIIGTSLTNINKRKTDTDQMIKRENTNLESLILDLKEYDNLPELEKQIEALEKKEAQLNEISQAVLALNTSIDSHSEISSEIARILNFLKIEGKVSALDKKAKEQATIAINIDDLGHTINQIEKSTADIAEYRIIVRSEAEVDGLLAKAETMDDLSSSIKLIDNLLRQIERTGKEIRDEDYELTSLQSRFEELMPDECPFGRGECKNK